MFMQLSYIYCYTDETCYVSLNRVYQCGPDGVSENTCESLGCCYNFSALLQCYYPSGKHHYKYAVRKDYK